MNETIEQLILYRDALMDNLTRMKQLRREGKITVKGYEEVALGVQVCIDTYNTEITRMQTALEELRALL